MLPRNVARPPSREARKPPRALKKAITNLFVKAPSKTEKPPLRKFVVKTSKLVYM